MAEREGIVEEWDQMGPAGTFSQLLFSPDRVVGLDLDHSTSFTYSASSKPPKMLCFGNHGDAKAEEEELHLVFPAAESEPTRSTSRTTLNHKKRNVSAQEPPQLVQCNAAVTSELPAAVQRNCEKNKSDNSTPAKARKEKLGERIAALQQLVSPFGKTDTASVLHEAMGYIRFLHDQVQVLCSPYLLQQRLPSSANNHHQPESEGSDLSSRGLCLVPVELTVHMANSNGADFWLPAMGNTFSSSSTSTKQNCEY